MKRLPFSFNQSPSNRAHTQLIYFVLSSPIMSSSAAHFNFVNSKNCVHLTTEERKVARYWQYQSISGSTCIGFIHGTAAGVQAYLQKLAPEVAYWTVNTYDCPHVA